MHTPRHSKTIVAASEVEWTAVRAQGPGGQNVNKVSSAVQLRFDVRGSSLPDAVKQRLLESTDQRLTTDGALVIKAQTHRSQERNKADAMARLQALVDAAAHVPKVRKATQPSYGSRLRRRQAKSQHSQLKALRGKAAE